MINTLLIILSTLYSVILYSSNHSTTYEPTYEPTYEYEFDMIV